MRGAISPLRHWLSNLVPNYTQRLNWLLNRLKWQDGDVLKSSVLWKMVTACMTFRNTVKSLEVSTRNFNNFISSCHFHTSAFNWIVPVYSASFTRQSNIYLLVMRHCRLPVRCRVVLRSSGYWTLRSGPTVCPRTSVNNYQMRATSQPTRMKASRGRFLS